MNTLYLSTSFSPAGHPYESVLACAWVRNSQGSTTITLDVFLFFADAETTL